tara:strand:- start:1240 stop:1590 length:351 start_codon:yes stop_codon:yes gene_type:complete
MTPREKTRMERKHQLALFLSIGIRKQKKEVSLLELLPQFHGDAAFTRVSALHAFVGTLMINAPHCGPGGHNQRVIKLDSLANRFVNETLGTITNGEFIPDGTPIGDPIFTASTPRR